MLTPIKIYREFIAPDLKIFETVVQNRSKRMKENPAWPKWCWLPVELVYALRKNLEKAGKLKYGINIPFGNVDALNAGLIAWGTTKGIYRFDQTLLEELTKTSESDDIPCEQLTRLPEWACFVDLGNNSLEGIELPNSVILFSSIMQDLPLFFAIEIFQKDSKVERINCLTLPISENSIPEYVKKTYESSADEEYSEEWINWKIKDLNSDFGKIKKYLNLALYLSSDEPEITINDKAKKPNKSIEVVNGKIQIPKETRNWDVGIRIGAQLRKLKAEYLENSETTSKSTKGKRPHIRRAHWHIYWVGSKSEKQEIKLNWVMPTLVGGKEIIPTIINVIKEDVT